MLLFFIEGVEQYPKTEKGYTYDTADIWQASADVSPWYGAWWGGNLRGVKDYPIDFGSKSRNSQIVYSPHDYGPSVYNQTWFDKDFTTQTLLDDYWYDTWALSTIRILLRCLSENGAVIWTVEKTRNGWNCFVII